MADVSAGSAHRTVLTRDILARDAALLTETVREAGALALDLARQARWLLAIKDGPVRGAERGCVAAIAGAALGGKAGEGLLLKGLKRLIVTLPETLSPEGGHATRSPQAALELLFDLTTLDDLLAQRGIPTPEIVSRAITRLPMAACRAISNMWRSISVRSFLTIARPRRSASRRSTMMDSASTFLALTRMSSRTRAA